MKQKQVTIIAVACGIVCAACVALFMAVVQRDADSARAEALARYGGEQVEVCVAVRDISAGERLDYSAVETKMWVADLLPDDAVRSSSDAIGQVVTSSILKGEVVTSKRFENSRETLDIPQGKQAVSVPAKAVQAVGGAVRPGMSVDVYSSGDTTTAALASGVIVLDTSVGDSGSLTSSDSGWITLAVEPERVQEVIAASNKTSLYFVIPGEQSDEAPKGNEAGEDADGKKDAESGGSRGDASDSTSSTGKIDEGDEDTTTRRGGEGGRSSDAAKEAGDESEASDKAREDEAGRGGQEDDDREEGGQDE